MLRTLIATTAIGTIALTAAFAQPAPTASPAPGGAEAARFVPRQMPDQWLASSFRGTNVVGPADEKMGDVEDILFDREGRIVAFVISVGDFLCIGAKSVALAPASFQVIPGKDASDYRLRLAMTKEQLKSAATFEPHTPQRPAASQTPPAATAPARPGNPQ